MNATTGSLLRIGLVAVIGVILMNNGIAFVSVPYIEIMACVIGVASVSLAEKR